MATFLSTFDLGIAIGSFVIGLAVVEFTLTSIYFYSSFLLLGGIFIYKLLYGRFLVPKPGMKESTHTG
ncbi:hypothetical protein [Thalassobacillus sp. C254]|uniref:hypothetical protein n=1 Tax=Thalassobacillus sp. C254 TaxID=1225341 RepID=UPI00277D1156|nr:hypothetical protein [Thalassobacillus sp. C254]